MYHYHGEASDCLRAGASAAGFGNLRQRWLCWALRAEILEGRLRPGARLPATRDLARQYGLARGTIVNALSSSNRGLRRRQRGIGDLCEQGLA
jgi:DNA-binding transcriptional MocR family regulator